MKAAVLTTHGTPSYADFPDPEPGDGQSVVTVLAASLNALDVGIAAGTHYFSPKNLPVACGTEGVGVRPDGTRVYFLGPIPPYGSMAEKSLVANTGTQIELPEGLPDATAATLGNAGLAALLPLTFAANFQAGETVLVLGATGVVGQLAVQAAKLLGAGKVIGAGRNPQALAELGDLGADATVRLDGDDFCGDIIKSAGGGVDVVLDYVWGPPAAAALAAGAHGVRLIQIGNRVDRNITIDAQVMRQKGAAVRGFGFYQAGLEGIREGYRQLSAWAVSGQLRVQAEEVPLAEVAVAWGREARTRHKLVLVP